MTKNWYVTMTDKYMSDWGMAAGRTNKLVIICDTLEEAEVVADNARRKGMKYVNITKREPRYNEEKYRVSWHDRSDYSAWFKPGAF